MRIHTRNIVFVSGSTLGLFVFAALAIGPQAPASKTRSSETRTSEARSSDPEIRRSVQQRPHTPRDDREPADATAHPSGTGPAVFPDEFRTIDGVSNNPDHPLWGASATDMMRMMPPAYPIMSGEMPARADGPSARAVSNAVCASPGDILNPANASDFLWQWGQFLDHDIDETPVGDVAMDIPVPAGDPWFDPENTGGMVIGMSRSAFHMNESGERQQINEITSFIDASNVYGADQPRADAIRAHDGLGHLRTSEGNLLPYNTEGFDNAPTGMDPTLFLAGDIRANEQVGLTAMHTLFMREHNYWADEFAIQFPDAEGDELYQLARAMVAAEEQAITFNEFLPVLLGQGAMGPYEGYDPQTAPMISNLFATAAYRMGHTMLASTLMRLDATDQEAAGGHLPLQMGFFVPSQISDYGIDGLLRGLASQRAQNIDTYLVDDVRNFLFGPPGSGGFDLASLNIQRGRDHGLPDYNSVRVAFGGSPALSFSDISADPQVVAGLASVYASVDEIDPWVGLLAEPAAPGSLVGPTLGAIMVEQFNRQRRGDRFWYESYLPEGMVELVNQQTLATIIRRNTQIGPELSDDVFHAVAPCPADINNDQVLDFFDISGFISMLAANDPRADLAERDGEFNFFDISEFIRFFNAGCGG